MNSFQKQLILKSGETMAEIFNRDGYEFVKVDDWAVELPPSPQRVSIAEFEQDTKATP